MTTGPAAAAAPAAPGLTAGFVAALQRGDEERWREFLTAHHAVFERALHVAARRAGAGRALAAGEPTAVDDAKVYFYEAFRKGFRAFDGEGRFWSFLFRTVANFVSEQLRRRRRAARGTADDGDDDGDGGAIDRRAVDEWQAQRRDDAPERQQRLGECVQRLPQIYRAVVLLHHFEQPAGALQDLAVLLGATVDAIHKRYQRALAMLRDCLSRQGSEAHVT